MDLTNFNKYHWYWLCIAFLMFFSLFRMAFPDGWDESFYLSQLSSAALDGDLMLQNDLLMYNLPIQEKIRSTELINREGFHLNAFSAGPAVFFSVPILPLYCAGAARFGLAFQRGIALWTALFWFFGMALLYETLKLFISNYHCRYLALFAAVFSSPFILYGTRFYLTAHYFSAILIIFNLYFWISWLKSSSYLSAWAVGLVSGFLVITRWESGVFFITFALPILIALKSVEERTKRLKGLLLISITGFLVVFIQMTVWKIQLDHWVCMPQESGFMVWSSPAIAKFFISGYHGLIPWCPGLLVGFIGLVVFGFRAKDPIVRRIIPGLVLFILIQIYISAATWDWWGGASYGPRRLTLLLAPAAMGWGLLLERCRGWFKIIPVILVIIWSGFTLSAYREQVDDLTLLLTGSPDVYRPASSPVTKDMIEHRWDHWREGFRHLRVPGFTLENRPKSPHRRSGFAILMGIVLIGEFLRRCLFNNKRCRILVLSLITLYVFSISVIMLTCFPKNLVWRDHWKTVVTDGQIKLTAEKYPRGYLNAAKAIITAHELKTAKGQGKIDPEKLYDNSLPGLTLQDLVDYSKN